MSVARLTMPRLAGSCLKTSGFGTNRTCQGTLTMAALEGRPEVLDDDGAPGYPRPYLTEKVRPPIATSSSATREHLGTGLVDAVHCFFSVGVGSALGIICAHPFQRRAFGVVSNANGRVIVCDRQWT